MYMTGYDIFCAVVLLVGVARICWTEGIRTGRSNLQCEYDMAKWERERKERKKLEEQRTD